MTDERRFNFTKRDIQELPLPTEVGKRIDYWDEKTRGLFVRVSYAGTKTFFVRRKVLGKSERLLLGRFPDLTIEQARAKAADFQSNIARGNNLADARRDQLDEMSLGELFQAYLDRHLRKKARKWWITEQDFTRNFDHWKNRKLSTITLEDIETFHHKTAEARGKYAANRAIELIRAIYNKGIKWRLYKGENPATPITTFPERTRSRILNEDELDRFFKALEVDENEKMRDFFMMCLFTGARRANVQQMKWADINFSSKTWLIPGEKTKTGDPYLVALTEEDLKILKRRVMASKSEFVFPGKDGVGHLIEPKRAWARILKRAGISDLKLHDLRRSMASWMANTGANASLIQGALNHKDIKTTMLVYAHTLKDAERTAKEAAQKSFLRRESKLSTPNVVPFSKRNRET